MGGLLSNLNHLFSGNWYKYWLTVLNDIQKRGIQDVLIFAIDGLNGFNEAIQAFYPNCRICF